MSGHFEAKKHAYRQTQDGIVVSFVVHPSDMSEAIAMAPLGTRFMVGFAEIGDDEKPKSDKPDVIKAAPENNVKAIEHKPKERFEDLPLVKQCVLRCGDEEFMNFFDAVHDRRLEESLADAVRRYCAVASRAEIRPGTNAAKRWLGLEHQYQNWLTDQKYGQARR